MKKKDKKKKGLAIGSGDVEEAVNVKNNEYIANSSKENKENYRQ